MRYFRVFTGFSLALAMLSGCATPRFVDKLLPPLYDYDARLVPSRKNLEDPAYTLNEDGSITYDNKGLRITVRYLSDKELNKLYPEVSYQDRFSSNPFTYGNWRDPELGYTPDRFTVFTVEVFNPLLPKVELFPEDARLRTNQGDEYIFYSANREESPNSFEDYYTLGRGAGGNEQYRFDQRMSLVREELYRPEHQVFKGDDYSGYLIFQGLDEEVSSVELYINHLALRFNESNHPTRSTDIVFFFDHKVEKRALKGEEARKARKREWILPGGNGG